MESWLVVVEVYNEYKQYGYDPVPLSDAFDLDKYDAETKSLLNEVFDFYGQFSASALVDMTHNEPPWKQAKLNTEISTKHLQDYFTKQLN